MFFLSKISKDSATFMVTTWPTRLSRTVATSHFSEPTATTPPNGRRRLLERFWSKRSIHLLGSLAQTLRRAKSENAKSGNVFSPASFCISRCHRQKPESQAFSKMPPLEQMSRPITAFSLRYPATAAPYLKRMFLSSEVGCTFSLGMNGTLRGWELSQLFAKNRNPNHA